MPEVKNVLQNTLRTEHKPSTSYSGPYYYSFILKVQKLPYKF